MIKNIRSHQEVLALAHQNDLTIQESSLQFNVTDPARDFIAHYRTFGREALDRLISAYAEAGGRTWSRMAEHVIELNASFAIDIAEFALKSGLDEYKQMARQSLGAIESD
jgi:macrolide phosphotransferase